MKRFHAGLGLMLILGLFFSAATVFASPAPAPQAKSTHTPEASGQPEKTPGAKATEKAVERATEGRGKQRTTYHGTVAAVGNDSLSLITTEGQALTFAVTADTKINVPGKGARGALTDLTPGGRVLVQAFAGDQLTALHIVLQMGAGETGEAAQAPAHRVGVVTAYTPGESITIQGNDGGATTFQITSDTKILPAARVALLVVGARVTIIAAPDSGDGEAVARGIVIQPAKAAATPTPSG